jgi:ribonuclease P protein component
VLPKINRLRKTRDIERVFKNGKAYREGFLFFKLLKNDLTVSRFAFAIGQKISKKATTRNRIKRTIREVAKKELPNIKPGFDGVLLALKGLETKNSKEIEDTVQQLLRKSGICR